MRRARAALLALLAAACCARGAGAATIADTGRLAAGDPACGTYALTASAGGDRWALPHGFVRPGSDSLWTRRRALRRGADYVLDPLRGEVRVLAAMAPGETLWVSICWLLAPPPLDYARQHYRPPGSPGVAAAARETTAAALPRPATGRDLAAAPGGASLALTGNKTVAVDFGSSQDAALRQSLDLALSGTLAPGVELTGVLSDRNTPLTAAGSTQDLQSLDRVLLELRAPHAAAALGDVSLAVHRGEFARLDRQVQGVRGEWHTGEFEGSVAAASAQGEYFRMQFPGLDGLQGPYVLTDRDGGTEIAVVAGSEIVTVDGARMARGESADYSMDYDRARLTFTNRRPISSASRITVEYQYALNRYRRNLASFSGEWRRSHLRFYSAAITESDDRSRPLGGALSATDLLALGAAGDSASRALGAGLTPGVGDYDTVRVGHDSLVVAYAGPDSGRFAARFARVGAGAGDYADSAIVAGRTVYRWVGPGRGSFVLGRALPLPESHQLVTLGGTATAGPFTLEAEGAFSRNDLNTASALDDGNDAGGAGRVALSFESRAGPLPGRFGVRAGERSVDRRFTPFTQLERPFAEEDWGLPVGADLEHQRRGDAGLYWRPRQGSELRADLAHLTTPDGYTGSRRSAEWTGSGPARTHLAWLDADGTLAGQRFARGGRQHLVGDAALSGRWLRPTLRVELDDRRTPGDSASMRDRAQDVSGELATGLALRWKLMLGLGGRLDRHDAGERATRQRATTWRAGGESPSGGIFGAGFNLQHRVTRDLETGARALSDLASVRLRGDHRPSGLAGTLDVEMTGEADNERTRTLSFVGAGRGTYDEFGNYVGTGAYELVLGVSPTLTRYARVATSARASWQFGSGDAWRGSRMEFTLQDEARRPAGPRLGDVFLSTGLALVDPGLDKGSVVQRLEGDLAPGSHVAALHVRAERRLSADRSFGNFAQTTDQRSGALRWRARPDAAFTLESQAQVQVQSAAQVITGGARYERTLVDEDVTSQLAWQPRPALRVAGALELDLARPEGQPAYTRTLRLGPDLGLNVGPRGRAELSVRRAFVSGPAAVSLLPSADPAGFARWDGTARFDLRLHETTTVGVSGSLRERPERPLAVTGRAEVRAFF